MNPREQGDARVRTSLVGQTIGGHSFLNQRLLQQFNERGQLQTVINHQACQWLQHQ